MIPCRNLGRFMRKAVLQPAYAGRVLLKRAEGLARHACGCSCAAFPEAVTLFLTHRCNLRCVMCGQWGEGGVTRRHLPETIAHEPELGELERFIVQLGRRRPAITLFGGEPLLYAGCTELIRMVKRRGMHCLMISNGTLLTGRGRELVESGLDELNVSVDGDRELHDRIRGVPGAFDAIMRGLDEIGRAKREAGSSRPLVNLQCTINRHNYAHLGRLTAVASEAGAHALTFHHLIFLGSSQVEEQKKVDALLGCDSADWRGFVAEPGIDGMALARALAQIRRARYPFAVDVYPNFPDRELKRYYEDAAFIPASYPARCVSPWLCAYVFPDGSVRPCLNSDYTFGNIKEGPLQGIWNSSQARRYRAELRRRKLFPACVRCTELYRY